MNGSRVLWHTSFDYKFDSYLLNLITLFLKDVTYKRLKGRLSHFRVPFYICKANEKLKVKMCQYIQRQTSSNQIVCYFLTSYKFGNCW